MQRCGNRSCRNVRAKRVHGLKRKPSPIRRAGVERRHPATAPAEDRLKLSDGCPRVRPTGGSNFSDAVRGPRHASRVAGFAKKVAERFFGERTAALAYDEGQIPAWSRGQRCRKLWQDLYCYLHAGLFRLYRSNTFAEVLAAQAHGIATAQPGVKQDIEPDPLARADRPAPLIGSNVILGPGNEAVAFRSQRIVHPCCRVALGYLCFERPAEKTAHGIEKVTRLVGCLRTAFASSHDGSGRDLANGLVTCRLHHLLENGFPMSARSR